MSLMNSFMELEIPLNFSIFDAVRIYLTGY